MSFINIARKYSVIY